MIVDREGELVESYPAVARLLAPEIDEFFIPGVKDTVDLDIEYLPPQLPGVVLAIADVLLTLLQVSHQLLPEVILLPDALYVRLGWVHDWGRCVYYLIESADGLIAHILPYDELVFAYFLVRVVILVLLGEVYAHAPEELARQGRNFLVEFGVEDLSRGKILLQQGQELQSLLV